MYSEKLQAIKANYAEDSSGAKYGVGIDRETLKRMIVGFCNPEDVTGVRHDMLFDLFDEYCKENGFPIVNRLTLGRAFCQVFGLTRRKAYIDRKLCWVYEKKEDQQ